MENSNKIKQYGFIPDKIDLEKDYILGGLRSAPFEELQPTGQWLDFLPEGEKQNRQGVETYSCVSFGTLNIIEILLARKFWSSQDKGKLNYSERFTAIVSNTGPAGNSPQAVAESVRKLGVVEDYKLPFVDGMSYELFFSPKPMAVEYLIDGRKFLDTYEIRHEFVFDGGDIKTKQTRLMESLKSSPVGVSVAAWHQRNGLYYKPEGIQDNHFVVLIGYEIGKRWIICDSYPESEGDFLKDLDWSYDFGMAKRYWIEKKEIIKLSIMEKIIAMMYKVVGLLAELVAKKVEEKPKDDIIIVPEPEIKPVEPIKTIEPPKQVGKLIPMAEAIKIVEGWYPTSRAFRNLNPGNLKHTLLTKELGATDKDPQNFCIFPTYEIGFGALCQFIKLAAENKLRDYKNKDLYGFFAIYCPTGEKIWKHYAEVVAKKIGVLPTTKLSDII